MPGGLGAMSPCSEIIPSPHSLVSSNSPWSSRKFNRHSRPNHQGYLGLRERAKVLIGSHLAEAQEVAVSRSGPKQAQAQGSSPGHIARATSHRNRTQVKISPRSLAPYQSLYKRNERREIGVEGKRKEEMVQEELQAPSQGALGSRKKSSGHWRPGLCQGLCVFTCPSRSLYQLTEVPACIRGLAHRRPSRLRLVGLVESSITEGEGLFHRGPGRPQSSSSMAR